MLFHERCLAILLSSRSSQLATECRRYGRIPSKDTLPLLIWAMDLILDKLGRILFFRRSKSIQTGRQEIRTRLYCLQRSIEKSSDTLRRDEFPRYRDYKTLYRNFRIAIYSSRFSFVSATSG